jgi:hypothetical protein
VLVAGGIRQDAHCRPSCCSVSWLFVSANGMAMGRCFSCRFGCMTDAVMFQSVCGACKHAAQVALMLVVPICGWQLRHEACGTQIIWCLQLEHPGHCFSWLGGTVS